MYMKYNSIKKKKKKLAKGNVNKKSLTEDQLSFWWSRQVALL